MRVALAVALSLAACAPNAPAPAPLAAPAAPVADQNWVGDIGCDPIPDIVHKRLDQRVRVQVRGGVARFERNVVLPDTSIPSGYSEHAEGAIGAGGALTLTGDGRSREGSYRAEYRGALPATGNAHFEGVQHWRFERHASYDRACTIDLHRES